MEKDKVLFLTSYFPFKKGGSEYQAFLLAEELKGKKQVSFLYIDSEGRPGRENVNGYMLYTIRKRSLLRKIMHNYFFLDYFKLMRLLNEINPDYIYQRVGFAYTGFAAHYAKKNNRKMIWHIASEIDVKPFGCFWNRAVLFDYIDKKCLEYGIRNADYVIGNAEYQNELLKRYYGRKCDLVIPNFHPEPECEISKSFPIKVVWIANIRRLKQPELFIKLAKEFLDYKDVEFMIIGRPAADKGWQSSLEGQINRLDNLKYLKERSIEEVNRILCESHILVNTSQYEGLPNTFVQAWFRKVPVISLNVDPDDILKNKKIGFHSKKLESMISDLKRLITDHHLREEMADAAQEYAYQNHSMEKNIKGIIRLFET